MNTIKPPPGGESEDERPKKKKKKSLAKSITPLNSTQLAADLGVSLPILRKYYEAIKDKVGERIGQLFCRRQVIEFYDHYGYPDRLLGD